MGLDMYLNARKFTAPEYFNSQDFEALCKALKIDESKMSEFPSISVKVSVAYWRKSNMIHKWFVENVQDGNDNCDEYPVNRETLKKLQELCVQVVKNKDMAKTALPTQEGFFFGNTEYDEWYYHDIEDTINQIQDVLENYKEEDNWTLSYQSSW